MIQVQTLCFFPPPLFISHLAWALALQEVMDEAPVQMVTNEGAGDTQTDEHAEPPTDEQIQPDFDSMKMKDRQKTFHHGK